MPVFGKEENSDKGIVCSMFGL